LFFPIHQYLLLPFSLIGLGRKNIPYVIIDEINLRVGVDKPMTEAMARIKINPGWQRAGERLGGGVICHCERSKAARIFLNQNENTRLHQGFLMKERFVQL